MYIYIYTVQTKLVQCILLPSPLQITLGGEKRRKEEKRKKKTKEKKCVIYFMHVCILKKTF